MITGRYDVLLFIGRAAKYSDIEEIGEKLVESRIYYSESENPHEIPVIHLSALFTLPKVRRWTTETRRKYN